MINKIIEKQLGCKFYWKDVEMDVIGIKAIGNYNSFINHKFSKSTFYNPKTNEIKQYGEVYRGLLEKGDCIFNKNYLVFKEGYETEYLQYVLSYTEELQDEDTALFNSLKDKSSFGRIKSYIKMFKLGVLKKETFISMTSDSLNNVELLNTYL